MYPIHMLQPPLFPANSLTVSEMTRYLRELLDSDEILSDIWVQGEVTNLARPASGHLYFTLKDASAALKCVIWKQAAFRMPLTLQNGMAIEAHGAVSLYERDGQYQLYVDATRLTGEGALYQEFLRLKARLEAEGLFAAERKRPLPNTPAVIGLVTSASGAALQDILNTLRRRFPVVRVLLAPCSVQGDEAPPQIIQSLKVLNAHEEVAVILVARGGGSLEDLWAFNDERVVRAIAESRIPVITGIGHETDFTLADFAADLRAATPTAAAEQVVPDAAELRARLITLSERLTYTLNQTCTAARSHLKDCSRQLETHSPLWRIRSGRQRLDELQTRLTKNLLHESQLRRAEVVNLQKRMFSLRPDAILQRGYAIIRSENGALIKSVAQVQRNDLLDIRISDGSILSRVVSDTQKENYGGASDGEQ